jgi:hypothetical protein
MSELGSLSVKVTADTAGLQSGINRSDKALKDFARGADGSARTASGSLNRVTASFTKMLPAITAAVGAFSIGAVVKDAVREQEQLQRNLMRTEALIKATGSAAGFTAEELHEQARQLAAATLESTEGVMQAQQVMLTFRSVTGETFTRATELASDLAAVTGGSLQGAMTQLGKALEDPVQGINAMTRSGVSFTNQQKETIKSLVETNQHAAAQKVILDELASQYGGVSRAQAMGLAGAQDTLAQSLQETKIQMAEYLDLESKAIKFYEALTVISERIGRIFTSNEKLIEQRQRMTAELFGQSEQQQINNLENNLRSARHELDNAALALETFENAIAQSGMSLDRTNPSYAIMIEQVANARKQVEELEAVLGRRSDSLQMESELDAIIGEFAQIEEANRQYAEQLRRDKDAQQSQWIEDLRAFHIEEMAEIEALQQYRDITLQGQLEDLRRAAYDEMDILNEKHAIEMEQLEQFLENKLITQQEYDELLLESIERREDAITTIETRAQNERARQAQENARRRVQSEQQAMNALTSLMNSGSRELFQVGKIASIAQATMNTYQGITNALANVPYPLNIGAAAAIGAAGFAQVANIKAQSFGSGASGGAASVTAGLSAQAQPMQSGQTGNSNGGSPAGGTLTVQGLSAASLFSGDAVAQIAEELLDFQRRGGAILIQG